MKLGKIGEQQSYRCIDNGMKVSYFFIPSYIQKNFNQLVLVKIINQKRSLPLTINDFFAIVEISRFGAFYHLYYHPKFGGASNALRAYKYRAPRLNLFASQRGAPPLDTRQRLILKI